VYRKRASKSFFWSVLFSAVLLQANLSGETPLELLKRSRSLPSVSAAKALLTKNFSASAELRPWYLLELARLSGREGNWSQSLTWSSSHVLSAIPADIADEVAYWHGEALVHTGQPAKAAEVYRKRLETGKASDPSLYLSYFRAASSGAEKMTARLDAAFPRLSETDPDTFHLSRYLGGITAVREGDWTFAVRSFRRFSPAGETRFPEFAPWNRYYLAYSQYRLGNWLESIDSFTFYIDTWKNHDYVWQAATAASLAAIQAGIDPLPLVGRAVRLAPKGSGVAESSILQASVLTDRKQYAEAESVLVRIADGTGTGGRTASSARALFMLADIAVRQKKPVLAEERWLALAAQFPSDPLAEEALYRSGEMWYLAGDWSRSSILFARYRQSWPSGRYLDTVLRNGGDAWNRADNIDLAILWWQELLRKYPESSAAPRGFTGLIAAYRKKGEYNAALETAGQYRKLFPSEATLDGMDEEIGELTKLSRGESADSAALLAAYIRSGRAGTAEGRAAGLRLARQYLTDYGTREAAKTVLKEIVAAMPRSAESLPEGEINTFAASWSLLGNLYREAADYTSASSALLSAGTLYAPVDGERSAEALYGAVDSFLQTGLLADAEKTAETLKKNWPDSAWTRRAVRLTDSL